MVHAIRDDKSAATFVALLGEYEGSVVCDPLSTHGAGEAACSGIVLCGCWAHVVRRFKDALPDFPAAGIALKRIGELYEIDEEAESAEDLRRRRKEKSLLVIGELREWLLAQPILRSTSIGSAIAYTLSYWDRLTRFLDDPRIPLDNNATERGVRGAVVGRRNHFGSKSRRGTEAASILYSLIETAKLQGVDPTAYLVEAVQCAQESPDAVLLPGKLVAP